MGDALHSLGFKDVADVRIGKLIEIDLKNGSQSQIEDMCKKLLANPVIENYEVLEVAGK